MELFQVLGKYDPSNIINDFDRYLLGVFWGTLRDPGRNRHFALAHHRIASAFNDNDSISSWHKDDDGRTKSLLLWTNAYPTEILLPDNTVVRGEPYDIVLIDNSVVRHRTPPDYVNAVHHGTDIPRYFARAVTHDEPSYRDVEEWKRYLSYANH